MESKRYDFIINPVSGKGREPQALRERLEEFKKEDPRDIRIHITNGAMDAADTAARIVRDARGSGVHAAIYACGGDGTINEAANGIAGEILESEDGEPRPALGVVPVGSGNDFVRYFGDVKNFLDIEKQLDGTPMMADLLRLTWHEGGVERSRFCINGLNIGLDGNTAILAHRMKELPLVKGSFSYLLALGINTAKLNGASLRIEADGKEFFTGDMLLCTVSNGRFCGGGVESCPHGRINDGLEELLLINKTRRGKLLRFFPDYKMGKLNDREDFPELGAYAQAKSVTIEPLKGKMEFVVDGEFFSTGRLQVDVVPGIIPVVVPEGTEPPAL